MSNTKIFVNDRKYDCKYDKLEVQTYEIVPENNRLILNVKEEDLRAVDGNCKYLNTVVYTHHGDAYFVSNINYTNGDNEVYVLGFISDRSMRAYEVPICKLDEFFEYRGGINKFTNRPSFSTSLAKMIYDVYGSVEGIGKDGKRIEM